MIDLKLDNPAFTLTVGELIEIIRHEQQSNQSEIINEPKGILPQYLYSIKDLSDFLHCSIVTAQKIKNSGKIRYTQTGRKLIFNTIEILEDLKK
jgi:hypothetical protein